jgi:hypothetical protein
VSAAAFAAAYFVATWISSAAVPPVAKHAAAVAALVAFIVFLAAEVRLMRSLDELQRLVQLEALAIAFPLSLALVMFLGLIQRFAELPVHDLSYRHVWPLMVLFYVIGVALATSRYR